MSEQVLRKVLWVDTIGSGLSASITLVGAGLLADFLGVSAWIPLGVGLALIPWVFHLLRTVRQDPLHPADVAVIVVGNIGWAVAAAVLIVVFPDALAASGKWLVGVFSTGVLALGVAQWIGLRGLASTAKPALA